MKNTIQSIINHTGISKMLYKGMVMVFLLSIQFVNAQDSSYTRPSWFLGVSAAANFNFYEGTTQTLTETFSTPTAFHKGFGVGLNLAPMVEYHKPNSHWGFMFQAGYDNRMGKFNRVISPCNCPADLSTNLTYITIEPSLRFAPGKSDFYLFAGPRVGLIFDQSFVFKQGTNPDVPDQVANPDRTGDFSAVNKTLVSMQVGAGYDIPLSSQNHRTQFFLSPFISLHPYFGQEPRSIESWNLTTVRLGIALKLGPGTAIQKTELKDPGKEPNKDKASSETDKVKFSVNAPKNIPAKRVVHETFPLRNYVFFDANSTEIPARYVLLSKDSVKRFKEDQVQLFTPKNLSGRSERQMTVYYNVLNILGDRMSKNPEAEIRLVGSSEKGADDGKAMAESVKRYLVNIWGISPARIATEGRTKPKIPSQQPGSTNEFGLLHEGDRRVSIESASPAMLMEFHNGPNAPLKPIEIVAVDEAPIESYVTFNNEGGDNAFSTWSLEVKDENGKIQYFGPYTQEKISIPGKNILGKKPEGNYTVTMVGLTKKGETVRKETNVHMVLWTPPETAEAMRFSVIYEFNESNAIQMYEKYLSEVVCEKIPQNGVVIIHGHTDVIGDAAYNEKLSWARANDVKNIMTNALAKKGRKDVSFQIFGFGEDESASPFENNFPEERFYNRTVIIDILPK